MASWLSSARDGHALARPGAPDRARRPGVPRPAAHHADDADVQPHPRAHRRPPGRLGQRAAAGALHAAVLADGPLRHRPADPGRREEAAAAGRVLGARAGADAGRAVAGDAAPDGVLPRPAGQVVAGRSTTSSPSSCSPRSPRAGPAPPGTSTTARRATRSTGAGTGRRPRRPSTSSTWSASWRRGRNSQFEVIYDVPGAGDPGRGAGAADADAGGGRARARPPRRRLPRRRDAALPGRLLPDADRRR